MNLLMRASARAHRIGGWLERRFAFDSRRNVIVAALAAMCLAALVSLLRGQDSNWDLRNYHLYNAYAWLTDRIALDLAPAQMQTYFPPLIDLPYFVLAPRWPMATAALLGAWHGLAFVLVSAIAWFTLAGRTDRARLAPVLGLAGCLSAVFLSELGNTMGDDTTAPLVLAALLLMLWEAVSGRAPGWVPWLAGVLLGLALALKLTNAVYAIALGLAVLAGPGSWKRRIAHAASLTTATVAMFALLAGPWMWRMWHTFGNPLFPQFNAWFQAPLAQPLSVADQRFLPHGIADAALRPLSSTVNPFLISEVPMPQLVWASLYLLLVGGLCVWLVRRMRGAPPTVFDDGGNGAARMLLVFVGAAFAIWLWMFSIHRYLATAELLGPLAIWLLARRLLPSRWSGRMAGLAIAGCVAAALAGMWVIGWRGWGHSGWHDTAFRVEAPVIEQPSHASVLLVGDEPHSWRVPFLPSEAMYASVASNFPESPAYAQTLSQRIAQRGGPVYALMVAHVDIGSERRQRKLDRVESSNAWAARFGLDRGDCKLMVRLAKNRRVELARLDTAEGVRCRLTLPPEPADTSLAALDTAVVAASQEKLARYGFALVPDSCRRHEAFIGTEAFPYQWCKVAAVAP